MTSNERFTVRVTLTAASGSVTISQELRACISRPHPSDADHSLRSSYGSRELANGDSTRAWRQQDQIL